MDDQEFKKRADDALHALYKRLLAAADLADFEADFNSGALGIEFEQPHCRVTIPEAECLELVCPFHVRHTELQNCW